MRIFVRRSGTRVGVVAGVAALLTSVLTVSLATPAAAQCDGTTLALAADAASHDVGSTATLTATLTDGCGDPLNGATVLFGAFAGPNAGANGSDTTDAAGAATFSYSSSVTGSDVWLAAMQTPAGTVFSNPVTITWAIVQTGRAYGISATGLVKISPRPDTGPVATSGDTDTFPPCVLTVPAAPVVLATTLCARVLTGTNATSHATRGALALANVQAAQVGVPGLPLIAVSGVNAISGTQCLPIGAQSYSSIAHLTIGPAVIIGSTQYPAPNTTINLGVAKLILNEQLPVPGADFGSTVNAVHLIVPNVLDLVLASATSDIHGCP